MVNILRLKKGKKYYIINETGAFNPAIILFKVVNKLKNKHLRSKGFVEVQFLKYVYVYEDGAFIESNETVLYENVEENKIIKEKIYKNDENLLFKLEDVKSAKQLLQEKAQEYDYENFCSDIDDYIPPEEYPDWDGDESIMYLLDHCNDYSDDDDENDEYTDADDEDE